MRLAIFCLLVFLARVSAFYSYEGREHQVSFEGFFRVSLDRKEEIKNFDEQQRKSFQKKEIDPTLAYLFGPLTYRLIGTPQKGAKIVPHWEQMRETEKYLEIPYSYSGTWILYVDFAKAGHVTSVLPYNTVDVFTPNWKLCSDTNPRHQAEAMLWFYWEPTRQGCEYKLNEQFQEIDVAIGTETQMAAKKTYPEYSKMIRTIGDGSRLASFTFAFGYFESNLQANPEIDEDLGAKEYRKFRDNLRPLLAPFNPVEEPILQGEYLGAVTMTARMGTRFTFLKGGVKVVINIPVTTQLNQVELFAKSFAHDKDSFFGWFGHSRIGQAFDAQVLKTMFAKNPHFYRVTNDYQLIYWAGCNSYAYFTAPFFKIKADMNYRNDPAGTKGLDIISNGLKSFFSENAVTALILAKAVLYWDLRTSYQDLIYNLENPSFFNQSRVLVNVLGDEDNN